MGPKETLDYLKSTKSSRVHSSLEAVFAICQEQVERGVSDFSISTISRLGFKRGVPKSQSIRNKTGEHYRILIQAFIESMPSRKPSQKPRAVDDWIDCISDPKLRMLVQIQASELAEAKKMIKEIIPPGLEIRIDDRRGLPMDYRLNNVERRALEFLVSEDFLKMYNFSLGSCSDVLDSDNRKIFKPGTLEALSKALRYL